MFTIHKLSGLKNLCLLGPFAPSVLRFQISFPHAYPQQPPLITFSTDIFHPLLTPLTTYTYTTSASNTGTVSASDQERLPPGGFSLRHGFPQWFTSTHLDDSSQKKRDPQAPVSIYELLDYLRYAFNEEACLDSITLEAAANPGAYHAWQSHRTRKLQSSRAVSPQSANSSKRNSGMENISGAVAPDRDSVIAVRGRRPGEWNWEGVWEERVKRSIQASTTDQVLFGNAGAADELIRFTNLNSESVEEVMQKLRSR
jgi:ubiquitin-conjugating enzyme